MWEGGLNPCFRGISFRRLSDVTDLIEEFNVLILVFVEYPFGGVEVIIKQGHEKVVLILVFVEYPFGENNNDNQL